MTVPMTDERLEEIRQRLAAGRNRTPWRWRVNGRWAEVFPCRPGVDGRFVARAIDDDEAALIAAAPSDLADLLAEVDRLRSLLDGMTDEWAVRHHVTEWQEAQP